MLAAVSVFLLGALWSAAACALLVAELLRRLLPLLDVHSVGAAVGMLRGHVLRRHRGDAAALVRRIDRAACRQRMTFPSGRTVAVESIVVWMSPADLEVLLAVVPAEVLAAEVARHYARVAIRQGWVGGPPVIALHASPRLPRGTLDLETRVGRPAGPTVPGYTAGAAEAAAATTPCTDIPTVPGHPADAVRTEDLSPARCSATITYRGRTTTVFSDGAPTALGRSSIADVRFEEPGVSHRHAVLDHLDGGWTIRPSESAKNGTFVDGARVAQPRRLTNRCIVRLGRDGAAEFATGCRHAAR